MKRGQLTLFVIAAIFIVGAIILFFTLRTGIISPLNQEAQNVHNFVQDCIEQEGVEMIYTIGERGGYVFTLNFSTESGVSFYYSDGESHMP